MSKAANTGNGYPSGMKNRIINGGMDISQRGTSFVNPTNTAYLVDRWRFDTNNDSAITVTQNSDVPSNNEFQNSLRFTVTTADASIGASQWCGINQLIEGYNIRDLIGRTFTLSFWVKSTKTGIHCASFCNGGDDRSYVVEYTVNSSLTWEYKTVTVTGGLPTAGTWNYTNGLGLRVRFNLAAGSTYQSTAGSWQTGNFTATSNQVNCIDTIGNIFAITGVQLELGPVATPFEHRLYGQELMLCQRYYYTYSDTSKDFQDILNRYSNTQGHVTVNLPVTMRTSPTIATSVTGTFFRCIFYDTASFSTVTSNATAISLYNTANRTNDAVLMNITHGTIAGTYVYASIDNLGIGGHIGFSAEL